LPAEVTTFKKREKKRNAARRSCFKENGKMENQDRVIRHLQLADILSILLSLAFLPLAVMGIFILNEEPGVMEGLAGLAGLIIGFIACGVFAVAAFILSLLTRRNKTFRVCLAVMLIFMLAAALLLSVY
jgi:hypothetical protein